MGEPQFVLDVDLAESVVTIGPRRSLRVSETTFSQPVWADAAFGGSAMVQASAHGAAPDALVETDRVVWRSPRDRIAPGQSLVFYEPHPEGDLVIGGAIAT